MRQLVDSDGGARRRMLLVGEALVPCAVHAGVVVHVDEKDRHVDDVCEAGAGLREDRFDVAQHGVGLFKDVGVDAAVFVDDDAFVAVV